MATPGPARRARRIACLAIAIFAATAGPSRARGDDDPIHLDHLRDDDAALLRSAERAVGAGAFDQAARSYHHLLEVGASRGRGLVVPVLANSLPYDPASATTAPLYESLGPAVRRRLRALPPRGLRAYRRRFDAVARGRIAAAQAGGTLGARDEAVEVFLFTTPGMAAAIDLGDRYFEAGDLLAALSTYDLVATDLGHADAVATRIDLARGLASAGVLAAPLVVDGPSVRRVPIASGLGRLYPDLTASPVRVGSSLVVAVPGRVAGVDLNATRPLAPLADPQVESAGPRWSAPPGAGTWLKEAHAFAPRAHVECAVTDGAAIGAAPSTTRPPPAPRPRRRLFGRRSAPPPPTASVGLFACDLEREGSLLWHTDEAETFGDDGEWLTSVRWETAPLGVLGHVVAAAIARPDEPEPEVHLAALDARMPRLAWRLFLCARSWRLETHRDAAPPTPQPRLARWHHLALVATGLGVRAGIDAFRGDIRWLAVERTPLGDPMAAARLLDVDAPAPVSLPRLVRAGSWALFSAPSIGAVIAVDPATGEHRWSTRTHLPARLVGCYAERYPIALDAEGLWLLDAAREGRAATDKLPLPARYAAGALRDDSAPPEIASLPGYLVVPLPQAILVIAVDERGDRLTLHPERVLPVAGLEAARPTALGPRHVGLVADGDLLIVHAARALDRREHDAALEATIGAYHPGLDAAAALQALDHAQGAPTRREVPRFRFAALPDGSGWSAHAIDDGLEIRITRRAQERARLEVERVATQ